MTAVGWLPAPVEELFGTEATAEESYDLLTVDVPTTTWLAALRTARDDLGCTYFDWLSAVDEPGTGFHVSAHVVALSPVRRLLVRTTVPHETPVLPTAVDVYAGAAWHERETHEMFGVDFEGHPALDHLLLPETFEGHPLRKDFVLAARVAKAWPGAKEPGESDHGAPKRRQMLPPGVPDPNEWGPLKGQLPAAPARSARGAGRAAGERPVRGATGERPVRGAAGERPVRAGGERPARGVGESPAGSAGASPARVAGDGPVRGAGESSARVAGDSPVRGVGDRPVRRARSASEGSVSQGTPTGGAAGGAAPSGEGARPPRRSRSASDGSASQQAPAPAPAVEPASAPTPAPDPSHGPASSREGSTAQPPTASRATDAPWHNARPAFEQPEAEPEAEAESEPEAKPESEATAPEATAPDPDAVERPDSPPPTPDTPAGGPQ
ncbi:NADH-quinone oxidoreductase subunit C [Streptomyces sp. NPDC050538]|uniref:NADH-quinone oxidoreductase subunit C n=1 Tax=Streptomyces sp. NPDC050538 TaxID=3365627 RepID=UPI00379C9792